MSTTSICHLPHEIIDMVVDELATDAYWYEPLGGNCDMKMVTNNVTTFQLYSLISRKFTYRVQKHLFGVINIADDDSAEDLSMILEAKPQLMYAIKNIAVDEGTLFNPTFLDILDKAKIPITLRISAERTSERPDYFSMDNRVFTTDGSLRGLRAVDTLQISCENVFTSIIRFFSNIKTLHLSYVRFNKPLLRLEGGSAFEFLSLTKLVIINVTKYPVPKELITGCVNLETLVLDNVHLITGASGPEVRLPKIINLGLGQTDGPITNLVDVTHLRVYEDRNYLLESSQEREDAEFAEEVFQEANDILRASSGTLESFYICNMITSCMEGRGHHFDLAAMKRLTSLTMEFDLYFDANRPAEFILDTIRTLRPRSIERGTINVRVRICGDDQLLAKVFQKGKWVDVLQELIRLSQIGAAVLTIQLNIESEELHKAVDNWCLSDLNSFPNTDNVFVRVETGDLGLGLPDFALGL